MQQQIDPVSQAIGSLTAGQKHLEESFERLRIDMAAKSDLIHGRLDEMMSEIRAKMHDTNNKTQTAIAAVNTDAVKTDARVTSLENVREERRKNKRLMATLWIGSGAIFVAIIEHWNDFFGRH